MLLPGRLLADVVRSLPPGEVTLELRAEQRDVEIAAGGARFHLRTLPAEDFPRLPELEGESVRAARRRRWRETIDLVARAASRDEVRPILTGVLVRPRATADDGRDRLLPAQRQAHRARGRRRRARSRRTCRRGRCASSPGSSASPRREEVEIALPRNQAVFRAGDVVLSSRLIEGQFPS